MVVGFRVAAGVGEVVGLRPHIGAGEAFGADVILERGLAHDLLREFQATDRHLAVVGVFPIVGVDEGGGVGVAGGEAHGAARPGAEVGGIERDAARGHGGDASLDPRAKAEMKLDVGGAGVGVGVPEAARLEERRGDGALAGEEVLQARDGGPVRFGVAVVGVGAGAFGDDEEVDVVLQVRADAGLVEVDGDAERAEVVGRAEAGELQEAGGADGAGGEDDLCRGGDPGAIEEGDAGGAVVGDVDAGDLRAGLDGQVGARRAGRR